VFTIVLIVGFGLIFSIERDCCEWENGGLLAEDILTGKTCKTIEQECKEEAASEKSTCMARSDCSLDDSANDEANVDIPQCAQGCSFGLSYEPLDPQTGRVSLCKFLRSFPASSSGHTSDLDTSTSCLTSCSSYDLDDLEREFDGCYNVLQYPNGCCEEKCQKVCAQSNSERGNQVGKGILMIFFGFVFAASFSCGMIPICCYAQDKAGVPVPMQGQPGVMMAPVQAQVVMVQGTIIQQGYLQPTQPTQPAQQGAPVYAQQPNLEQQQAFVQPGQPLPEAKLVANNDAPVPANTLEGTLAVVPSATPGSQVLARGV
jgi:hypothetical protein